MDLLYTLLVFASSIALASLITALLSWRGRENKLTYSIVFIVLCYVFIVAAFEFLFIDNRLLTPWQQWQEIYEQFTEDKTPAPKHCKKTPSAIKPPAQ